MNKNIFLTSNFTIKSADGEEDITIEGYANTTTKDRVGDIILEEAWVKGGLNNYLKNPIVLAYHDHKNPIGEVLSYNVSNKGLHVTAKISKAAGNVYNLVKQGVLKAFSVGFTVKDADYDSTTDIFVIKDLELYELSVVSVPANADSLFSLRKSFTDEEQYNEYKNSFDKKALDSSSDIKGDTTVPDKNKIELTPEELASKEAAAVEKALAAIADEKAKNDAIKAVAIEAGATGAEKLFAEVEKRFADKDTEVKAALEGLRAELKEKNDELTAMHKSKMSFEDKGGNSIISVKEVDQAVLLSKIMGVGIDQTKYFKDLVEKVGDHLTGSNAANYETEFSTRMYDAIRDRLVLEPLFINRITMNSRSMVFPFNPEAGHANWVSDTSYKTSTLAGESSGTARTHSVTDITIKAEKLATKEALGYEEEEDSIIPILPIIQAAITRRMARTTDMELLRADLGGETVAGTTDNALINGVATLANDVAANGASVVQSGAFGTTNPVTIGDLQAVRRKMGVFGMNPADVVYIVNQSVYFDLLEDPDFRTVDLVGSKATILTGQIGTVNGSPVIVSDAFATPAIGATAAIALNASNYIFGELRGLTTERDRDVLNQKNWLVSTRRFAFTPIIPMAAGTSSCSTLIYPAA